MIKLYGSYTSPFVRHCRVALIETGLEWDFIETDHSASAKQSPTKKVPFLRDGDLTLTDSLSILKHIRESAGQGFLTDVRAFDAFCLVNTSLDACVNLFMLERDGIGIEQSQYLKRQSDRVHSTLSELNELALPDAPPYNDFHLRLGCYLAWGLYRQRFTLDSFDTLTQFLQTLNQHQPFNDTAPPQL